MSVFIGKDGTRRQTLTWPEGRYRKQEEILNEKPRGTVTPYIMDLIRQAEEGPETVRHLLEENNRLIKQIWQRIEAGELTINEGLKEVDKATSKGKAALSKAFSMGEVYE